MKRGSKFLVLLVFSTFLFILFPHLAFAQVVINEVLPDPLGDDEGAELVELFNKVDEAVQLKDCVLYLHKTDNYQKVVFGEEAFIDKYETISWDGSWLNNSGDQIRLVCPNFSDFISYGSLEGSVVETPGEGYSFGRSPDGSGDFYLLDTLTFGNPNSIPPIPSPSHTQISSPTSKPTVSPTVTPISTPRPTVKPTTTPKATARVISLDEEADNESLVLGLREELKESPSPTPESEEKKNFPLFALGFVFVGVGFLGFAGYSFFIQKEKGYTGKSENSKENSTLS